MKVYIPIYFKDSAGNSYKKTIQYINPEATNGQLRDFILKLNSLTDNRLEKVLKVVEEFLHASEYVTKADIDDILNGDYQQVADDDPITQADIDDILNGVYQQAADDDPITQADIDKILAV